MSAKELPKPEPALLRPKTLRPSPGADPILAPARMINEVLYCERLAALEWVHGEFADNAFTVDGRHVHRRVDVPTGALASPPADRPQEAAAGETPGDTATDPGAEVSAPPPNAADSGAVAPDSPAEDSAPAVTRSVWLSSHRLGITAKIDLVEEAGGFVVPVDYKRGRAPAVPEGAYLPERAQSAAQVMVLRDHGFEASHGVLYFAGSRRRVTIEVDAELERIVLDAAERLRALATVPELPPPLVDSPKCHGCSLAPICLPDEISLLRRLEEQPQLDLAWAPEAPPEEEPGLRRRLTPSRDDREVLYVQDPGSRIRLERERLIVTPRGGGDAKPVRLPNTSQVCLFGSVQISTQAIHTLMEREIPLCFFSGGGYFLGRTVGNGSNDIHLRIAQHALARDVERCTAIARGLIASKIRNCRTLLRRNVDEPDEVILSHLEQLAKKAEAADSAERLLGIEGAAARAYFEQFPRMLKGSDERLRAFDLEKRNRRPPADRINALLSFCYALLTKELTVTLGAVGLDPLLGVYHRPRFGRPGLALDLMEEMRPVIADSTVLGLVNNNAIDVDDFIVHAGASVALKPDGRKKVLAAFERRLTQQVTHPVFGYRVSYRRILEVQARLLARLILGDIHELPPFRVR